MTAPDTTTWARGHRSTLLIVGGFVLAVVVATVVGTGGNGRTARYDPANAGPVGGQAVAMVLADQGIDIEVARTADELDRAVVGEDTVIVVTSTEQLGTNTVKRLMAHARGHRVVLIDPGQDVVEAVGAKADIDPIVPEEGLPADCQDEMFTGLTLDVDTALLYTGDSGCFESKGSSVLVASERVTLFGGGEALTNDQVLRGDNAAIGLRLLGQGGDLVWYVPDITDVGPDEGFGVVALLPQWIVPGLWIAAISIVALVVWRARRLGSPSTEPLPVVVRAIETTHSRGRLYRKSQDRAHAASVLRAAARGRATRRQGVGASRDADAVIRSVAHRTGRPQSDVAGLIGPDAAAPESDRDLIVLANRLAELEGEELST
jgi:hypothetical protein